MPLYMRQLVCYIMMAIFCSIFYFGLYQMAARSANAESVALALSGELSDDRTVGSPSPSWDGRKPLVNVELVLLADISNSMSDKEKLLQREGYMKAFMDKKVIEAFIDAGPVAITYIEYATETHVVIPWTVIETPQEISMFGQQINYVKMPIDRYGHTNIKDAIEFSIKEIESNGYESFRQIIDISGDGVDNHSKKPELARDLAVKKNIKINGLPIIIPLEPAQLGPKMTPETPEELIKHYKEQVITPNGFIIPSDGIGELKEALIEKLRMELM